MSFLLWGQWKKSDFLFCFCFFSTSQENRELGGLSSLTSTCSSDPVPSTTLWRSYSRAPLPPGKKHCWNQLMTDVAVMYGKPEAACVGFSYLELYFRQETIDKVLTRSFLPCKGGEGSLWKLHENKSLRLWQRTRDAQICQATTVKMRRICSIDYIHVGSASELPAQYGYKKETQQTSEG